MLRRSMMALLVVAGGLVLLATPASAQDVPCDQVTACSGDNCDEVSVAGGNASPGGVVDLQVHFRQPASDGSGNGSSNIAALAMTIGLGDPGLLSLADCNDNDGDGLPDAIVPSGDISDQFRLVVENVECPAPAAVDRSCHCKGGINRCLCPGNNDTRDNFVNVVVYGPKDIPTSGGVPIPRLPDSADLMNIRVRVSSTVTPPANVPITIFAGTDHNTPKPRFGACLSIGDQAAVDQTAQGGISKVNATNAAVMVEPGGCHGDCNNDGVVEVNELVLAVDLGVSHGDANACPGLDLSGNGSVEVDEILRAVDDALNGCQ